MPALAVAGSAWVRPTTALHVERGLHEEERPQRARVVAPGHLHVEYAQEHGDRRERMAVEREDQAASVAAGGRLVGHAEAQDERHVLTRADRGATRERRQRIGDGAAVDQRRLEPQYGQTLLQERLRSGCEPHGERAGGSVHDDTGILELAASCGDLDARCRTGDLDGRRGRGGRQGACREQRAEHTGHEREGPRAHALIVRRLRRGLREPGETPRTPASRRRAPVEQGVRAWNPAPTRDHTRDRWQVQGRCHRHERWRPGPSSPAGAPSSRPAAGAATTTTACRSGS